MKSSGPWGKNIKLESFGQRNRSLRKKNYIVYREK